MSDKQAKIKKMLEMQHKFIEREHAGGVLMEEYFTPSDDSPLKGYRDEYRDLAMGVVGDAHKERGSQE